MPRVPDQIAPEFERFAQGPAMLRRALEGLDAGAFNRRPPGEDWSIRDVVMHVTDAELVRSVSLRLVIAQEGATIPQWDEALFKRKLHYLFRDPELALTLLQLTRYSNAELVQQLDAASWERSGTRAEDGEPANVMDLVRRATEHDLAHCEQVLIMRETLGVPLQEQE